MSYILKKQLLDLALKQFCSESHTQHETEKIKNTTSESLELYTQYLQKTNEITFDDSDFRETVMAGFPHYLMEIHNMPNSSAHNLKSRIRKLRDIFVEYALSSEEDSVEFSVVLAYLINTNSKKIERSKLAKKFNIPTATFNRWFRGEQYPNEGHIPRVEKLETYFNKKPGFLTKRLGNILFGEKTKIMEARNRSPLSEKLNELTMMQYSLPRSEWPKRIEKEFQYLSNFHLIEDLEETVYEDFARQASMVWGGEENPTGTYYQFQQYVEKFLGFLILPKSKNKKMSGLELPIEDISLFLLTDYSILFKFFSFSKSRLGHWTNGIKTMAKRVRALLNPEYGIFTQSVSKGEQFLNKYDYDVESWEKHCTQNLKKIKHFISGKKFKPLCDPYGRVIELLDLDKPYELLKEALDKGQADIKLPGLSSNRVAVRYRDFLIFFFHILFGFRSEHFSNLKIGEQLIRDEDGWFLCIFQKDLKRKSVMKQDRAKIKTPSDVSEMLDEYIEYYRPILDCQDSNYLFPPSKNATSNRTNKLRPARVSKIFKEYTECYLDTTFGLSSHDSRKIIATVTHLVSCDKYFEKGSTILLHDIKTHKSHYTINEIRSAFRFHFEILEENRMLNKEVEVIELNKIQKLEDENYEMKQLVDALKEQVKILRTDKNKHLQAV